MTDLKLHATCSGDGDLTVLLIHGWASSNSVWQTIIDDMCDIATFYAVDLAGFGNSPRPVVTPSLQGHVNSVAAYCTTAGIQPDVIMGHSMGGMITLQLLHQYPNLAKRFVLIGSVVSGQFGIQGILSWLVQTPAGNAALRHSQTFWNLVQNETLVRLILPPFAINKTIAERIAKDFLATEPQTAIEALLTMAEADARSFLPEIAHPALIIAGTDDFMVPPKESVTAADLLPNAVLHLIENTRHLPQDEKPDAVLPLIRAFLCADNDPHSADDIQ
jgi:pimeloyl-ACP methyl ester carboxylesterase